MKQIALIILFFIFGNYLFAQTNGYWHNKERVLRYHPEGTDFVTVNGDKKFNKALYGTNTAFRIETGDLPELGFFMPNMGGNMQFGLIVGDRSIWLNDAEYIKSIYRAGSRIYEIKDPLIGQGKIYLTVLAMDNAEGMILKIESEKLPIGTQLISLFGGASNKRFFRNGDLGVDDPNAFSLQADACLGNQYSINKNEFSLIYAQNQKGGEHKTIGIFPEDSDIKKGNPYQLMTPIKGWQSEEDKEKPILISKISLSSEVYIALKVQDGKPLSYSALKSSFESAEKKRKELAETIKINTPDPYLNTLGGILGTAADGIWDDNTGWQHGAIGWRMPLNGWRGAYAGDAIGWHNRARKHFDGYAASQITNIEPTISHPAQDQNLNLARAAKIWGTQMYSNGYITRNPYETDKMHHYDMNLGFIDQLLWHFNWTGDMDYVRKMWPVLKSHLAWEKRNFDPNDDGLYDAYACIWASDALQYNSGAVTHSSAYNYRANKMAADIARKIGEDPSIYEKEANKILSAINSQLWLPSKGWWAEYKDYMGDKMTHPNAALWTIYHAIDSDVHTPFQAYQATRYIDNEIPHIPVRAKGLDDDSYKTVATTNWLPYSWSINNVAFAEVAHTSLAYWQAGRKDEALKLFKSSILDGMYLGDSPGNIGQVSFYDAARGECYRDFADPIGIYSRALIQGLFGILPDAMNEKIVIRPGLPSAWDYASISTPDISFDFVRKSQIDLYSIDLRFEKKLSIELLIEARKENIANIKVNGKNSNWTLLEGISKPLIKIEYQKADKYEIEIVWAGDDIHSEDSNYIAVENQDWTLTPKAQMLKLYDPQNVLANVNIRTHNLSATIVGDLGHRTVFIKNKQGQMIWWQPINIEIVEPFSVIFDAETPNLTFSVTNNTMTKTNSILSINKIFTKNITLNGGETSNQIEIPNDYVKMGSNLLQISENGKTIFETKLVNWNLKNKLPNYKPINIDKYLNASVNQIFKNEYLTPRSPFTTLQVPKQGIGEWCHPTLTANIDDSGIRNHTKNNIFKTPFDLPFLTTGDSVKNNIAFTSLWDNYPDSISIPLSGKASHAYLLMAGSTNHMQSHVINGIIEIIYADNSKSSLNLINPETWAPIEQDFYTDGYAFSIKMPRPYRVALKSGIVTRNLEESLKIKSNEVYGRTIDGGAAIILDLPLNKNKELKEIRLKSIANEVVIGLMGVTLLQ